MKKLLIFLSVVITTLLLAAPPTDWLLGRGTDGSVLGGNFILDMTNNPVDSTKLVIATGSGISVASPVNGAVGQINFMNRYLGQGGLSAISYTRDGQNLWATTAADTFITENGLNEFLQKGTGVHLSKDNGLTWTHFQQPGKTAIQGLTYDIACDTLNQVWLASFGQSLQVSPDNGQNWQVIVPDSVTTKEMFSKWKPVAYPSHRLFAVHYTPSKKMWLGTAQGIILNKNIGDSLSVDPITGFKGKWKWQTYTYPTLTGNFVTAIQSQILNTGRELVWAATWSANGTGEVDGVSMTPDKGKTWQRFLTGEKVYNFGFVGNKVFACSESGLWMADSSYQFEKYKLKVYSNLRQDFVEEEIQKVYSFYYFGNKMWIGTGRGLLVSEDLGKTFKFFEAYQQEKEKVYSFPNPFSPSRFANAKLYFNMESAGNVNCTIYNFAMEKVCDVAKNVAYSAGDHYLLWNGRDTYNEMVANGAYFFVIKKNGKELWNKILVFD